MQRRVYVPGAAALLVALLAGCTGSSGTTGGDDGKSGESSGTTAVAEPGKYRTLPEPCGTVEHSTLDSMLPGIQDIEDATQREKAYEGSATVTYDTDRRVGCRWKTEGPDATHHLFVDFERVVSYDGTVSDDTRAEEIYRAKLKEAGIPEPSDSETSGETDESGESGESDESGEPSASGEPGKTGESDDARESGGSDKGDKPGASDAPSGSGSPEGSDATKAQGGAARAAGKKDDTDAGGAGEAADGLDAGSGDADDPDADPTGQNAQTTPPGYEPRALDDLGDEAFVNDALTTAASATRHRTVTVVFRTSNVIVTVEYDEQPARRTEVPDSKEMQDNARELAEKLGDRFGG